MLMKYLLSSHYVFFSKMLCSLEQQAVSLTDSTAHVLTYKSLLFFPALQHGFHCHKTFGIITLAETLPSFVSHLTQETQKIHKTTYISHLILNYTKPHRAPWLLC